MVDIVISDDTGMDVCVCDDFSLDVAFGSDEQNFTLQLFDGTVLHRNYRWRIDGTELGGIVDQTNVDTTAGNGYAGADWHGILQSRVLVPDNGADYLTVSGDLNTVISQMLSRCGLTGLFEGGSEESGFTVNYRFNRYAYLYDGLKSMCAGVGAKLRLGFDEQTHRTEVTAVARSIYEDTVDNDLLDFTAKIAHNRINHLIALGKGELADRIVQHWYADTNGTISQKQTITGLDERIEVYDYSNADAAELSKQAQERLEDYQSAGEINVTITDDMTSFDIGDLITARDNTSGLKVSATVSKKIIKATGASINTTYETTAKTI